jgi:hypothetical protein
MAKKSVKFVWHSQSPPSQNEHPVDNYHFQIFGYEKEVNAANSHLCNAEEDVDPQSETQNVTNDGTRLQIQVDTTKHKAIFYVFLTVHHSISV